MSLFTSINNAIKVHKIKQQIIKAGPGNISIEDLAAQIANTSSEKDNFAKSQSEKDNDSSK